MRQCQRFRQVAVLIMPKSRVIGTSSLFEVRAFDSTEEFGGCLLFGKFRALRDGLHNTPSVLVKH